MRSRGRGLSLNAWETSAARRIAVSCLGWAFHLAVPPLGSRVATWITGLALGALGSALCAGFMVTTLGWPSFVGIVAGLTVLHALAAVQYPGRVARVVRLISSVLYVGFSALWLFLAIAFGLMLGWTLPEWIYPVIAVLLAIVVVMNRQGFQGPRLPVSVVLGIWTLTCLNGWLVNDGAIRCDDYLRLADEPGVELVVPTTPLLGWCQPDDRFVVDRYARRLWESPDGSHLLMTSQRGSARCSGGRCFQVSALDGSYCATPLDGSSRPSCLGTGTAQGIMEVPDLDRVYVGFYGGDLEPGQFGGLVELPGTGDLEVLRETRFTGSAGEGFYEPTTRRFFMIADEAEKVFPVDADTMVSLPTIPGFYSAGEVRYDPSRDEGLFCFGAGPVRTFEGQAALVIAMQGNPFEVRILGGSDHWPLAWAGFSWGCDFDPVSRRVYATVPALGLVAAIDYDSGEVIETRWIGLGFRSATLDLERSLLYVSAFFSGEVLALDLVTLRPVGRWFAGRFVRQLVLSRDGSGLFVTSNLGIVRIELTKPAPDLDTAATERCPWIARVLAAGPAEESLGRGA